MLRKATLFLTISLTLLYIRCEPAILSSHNYFCTRNTFYFKTMIRRRRLFFSLILFWVERFKAECYELKSVCRPSFIKRRTWGRKIDLWPWWMCWGMEILRSKWLCLQKKYLAHNYTKQLKTNFYKSPFRWQIPRRKKQPLPGKKISGNG